MSEAAQLILKSITSAIETTLNPLASQSDRHDAYLFIEEFKEKSPLCSEVGWILVKNPGLHIARNFGLQLLEHSIRYRWNIIGIQEKLFIKDCAMELLNGKIENIAREPSYLKDGIGRLIVEMAKREWPQQWPTFLTEIFEGCDMPNHDFKVEVSLLVLLRLSEDIGLLEKVENPKRRRDLYQQFTTDLPLILEFLNVILGRYASPTLLASPREEVQTVASTLILAALRALNSIYEWCSLAIISKDEPGFFIRLLRLLNEPRFRILAAECLISVLSRRDHHTVILAKIFNSSQIESIISAVGFNAGQSVSEESYVFEKKCAEIFISLGSVISYLWSRNADFTLPDYAPTLFKVLVDLADHDSVVIREGAVLQLNLLLKIPKMESTQFLEPIISSLIPVLIRRLPKVGYPSRDDDPSCKLSSIDFDSDEEFVELHKRFSSTSMIALRYLVDRNPALCFSEGLKNMKLTMHQVVQNLHLYPHKDSALCATVYAAALCVDSIFEHIFKDGSFKEYYIEAFQLLQEISHLQPKDIYLQSLLVSCVSSLIYSVSSVDQAKFVSTYCLRTVDECKIECNYRKQEKYDLRRHSFAVLVKCGRVIGEHMLPLLDDFLSFLSKMYDNRDFSSFDIGMFKEMIVTIVNQLNDSATKKHYLTVLFQRIPDQWNNLPVQSFESFLEFYGISSLTYLSENFIKRRKDLMEFLQFLKTILQKLEPINGKHPVEKFLVDSVPSLFRLFRGVNQLYASSDPSVVSVLGLSKNEKIGLLSEGISHGTNYRNVPVSISKTEFSIQMEKFLPQCHSILADIIGFLGVTLGKQFYYSPGLAQALLQTCVTRFSYLPGYRQKMIIKNVLAKIIESCPIETYETITLPLLSELIDQVIIPLDERWKTLWVKKQNEETDEAATEEDILGESVTRHLTREFVDLLFKVVTLGSRHEVEFKKIKKIELEESRNCKNDEAKENFEAIEMNEEMKDRAVGVNCISELAKTILSCDEVAQKFLLALIRAIAWPDSSPCRLAAEGLSKIIEFMQVHVPDGAIGFDLALSLLTSSLHGLEVNGEHETERNALLNLCQKILNCCLKAYPNLIETLNKIPQKDDGLALRQYLQTFNDCATPVVKLQKQRRDLLKKITEQIVGKHSGQLHKREVHMSTLPPLGKGQRRVAPPISDEEIPDLCNLFCLEETAA
ncbi:exportin-5-like isoform X1 [Artemia franciscana]